MADQTVSDFQVGDRVQHVFFGSYASVVKVGRVLLHVAVDAYPPYGGHLTYRSTWRPTSVRKVS